MLAPVVPPTFPATATPRSVTPINATMTRYLVRIIPASFTLAPNATRSRQAPPASFRCREVPRVAVNQTVDRNCKNHQSPLGDHLSIQIHPRNNQSIVHLPNEQNAECRRDDT